mmetsp:Transcript_20941/g.30185  ORF Transcript_20941/g.30185 Transcript_20941/m.30185 type:complete len:378 (-) Transcript_20941:159-1292(-)
MCQSKATNKAAATRAAHQIDALQLGSLRKALPEDVFVKSLAMSLYHLFFDLFMWIGTLTAMYALIKSDIWATMPFWGQAVASFLYWNVAGFFMWCLFVVGHDCGHGTFSNYEWLNDLIGHIVHGSILVPYWPWQLSHRRHHMYHNHEVKDYSHPWITPERMARPDEGTSRFFHKHNWLMGTFPYYGWAAYLYGLPDGNHFIPFPWQRMWAESESAEYIKAFISSAVVIAYATGIYLFCGDFVNFAYYYLAPIGVFGWWLVTVTYLQHHSPNTLVYGDDTWKYVDAAFETVDRKYGFGIDYLSHHITDGHVVHHLFFTKIPHYNLYRATEAMKSYLKENNLEHMYKFEETYDFFYRVHAYFMKFGFKATKFGDSKKQK